MARVTSKDVAKRAGVSQSVVSAVLNGTVGIRVSNETRQKVLEAIKELNYQVDAQARGLRLGRSKSIAVSGNLDMPFLFHMLQGVQQACLEEGYHVLLYGYKNNEDNRMALIDLFEQRRIDGIIIQELSSYNNPEWADMIHTKRVPYIALEGYPEDEGIPSIIMDYGKSVALALDYLWKNTELPPAYLELYGDPQYKPNWDDRQRTNAYREWMAQKGFEPKIVYKFDNPQDAESAWWEQYAQSLECPAAVIVNWSRGAVRLYKAAMACGLKIGKDIYVMAADNTEGANAFLVPALSSIEVPYVEMGFQAAKQLIGRLEGKKRTNAAVKTIVSPKLIIGESAGENR